MEVYNPRVAIGSFNEEAERFARQVPDPRRGRVGLARRAGARLGPRADARLRRAGGVPGVPARRPRSSRSRRRCCTCRRSSSSRRRPRHPRPARPAGRAACAARHARADAAGRATRLGVQDRGTNAPDRRRDPREIPRAGHPRAQRADPRSAGLRALPARQPDAGPGVGPPAGRRVPAEVRAGHERGRGGRRLLRPRRHRADEVVQAPGDRPARRVRDAVREVPGRRRLARRPRLRRARRRGARDRAAADRRRHGRRRADRAQRPRHPALQAGPGDARASSSS